jgi:hypothetical protein
LPALAVSGVLILLVTFARMGMPPPAPTTTTFHPPTPTAVAAATVVPTMTASPAPSPSTGPTTGLVTLTTAPYTTSETGFSSRVSPWPDRFADGIPSVIEGEVVHRVSDSLSSALFSEARDSGSILIGGWYSPHDPRTPACDPPPASCGSGQIADSPLQLQSDGVGVDGIAVDSGGPIVIRGSARTECAPPVGQRILFFCLYAIRAEAVVWRGDEFTVTEPIPAMQLLLELRGKMPAFYPQPYHDQPACLLPRPAQAYRSVAGKIQFVFVFPTTDERVAGATSLLLGPPYGDIGSGCDKRPPLDGQSGWISVENVIVRVDEVNGATGDKVRKILNAFPVGAGG